MMLAAVTFLDHLEQASRTGGELPIPYVMERIRDLLDEALSKAAAAPIETARIHDVRETEEATSIEDVPDTEESRIEDVPVTEEPPAPIRGPSNDGRSVLEAEEDDIIERFRDAVRKMNKSNEPIFVDIQYLNSSAGYIIKEFAAKCADGPTAWITVKPAPDVKPFSRDNHFAENRVHGLRWTDGVIDEWQLSLYTSCLFRRNRTIFVKGIEKERILTDRLNIPRIFIRSLEEYPRLDVLCKIYRPKRCPFHRQLHQDYSCAMKHAEALMSHRTVVEE